MLSLISSLFLEYLFFYFWDYEWGMGEILRSLISVSNENFSPEEELFSSISR